MIEYTFVWPHSGNHIIVTGSFDNWTQSTTLNPSSEGHSHTLAIPVEKTLFKFVVDGEWKVDESFATETDEHGNVNNVLTVDVLEKLEGNDIQEITQDIPGAFPHEEHDQHVEHENASALKSHDKSRDLTSDPVHDPTATPVVHDLQPSHVTAAQTEPISHVIETKREAVSGGAFIPPAAESAIPAASTTSQHEPVSHDLQPSNLDHVTQHKLEDAIESKYAAVESGDLEPVAGVNRETVTEPEHVLGQVAGVSAANVGHVTESPAPHATESPAHVSPPSPTRSQRSVPVASFGVPSQADHVPETSNHVTSDVPPHAAAAAAHALTMHDLQPSALDPHAEATLDQTISTKYSAVESGAISPVDSTGQSRAVPSTPTRGRHDSEYDHVSELRDEYGGVEKRDTPRSREHQAARDQAREQAARDLEGSGSHDQSQTTSAAHTSPVKSHDPRVPASPGLGTGFEEIKPKKKDVAFGDATDVASASRFHENETAPPSPTPMSPHLSTLAQKEGIDVVGTESPAGSVRGAGAAIPAAGAAGAAIPAANAAKEAPTSTSDSAAVPSTASSLHSAAATKSVAPGTPSSTALNLNVPVTSAANAAAKVETPAGAAKPATPATPASNVVAAPAAASAHASSPATAADVTITAGSTKKEKRRSIFRKIKDKMF